MSKRYNVNGNRIVRRPGASKARYMDLFDDPGSLFDGADVSISGESISIRHGGSQFIIRASVGPMGFALRVRAEGWPNKGADIFPSKGDALEGVREIDMLHYFDTDTAQQYRREYIDRHNAADAKEKHWSKHQYSPDMEATS